MTPKRHPQNERVKRRYLQFLREVKGRDPASVDGVAKALECFDSYNRYRDLRKFHIEQAQAFKANLAEQIGVRSGKPLSASTINSTLAALKAFFVWLADQSEYRARIRYCDAEYFNPPDNLARVATAHRPKKYPTMDEIRRALAAMPTATETERRDRALLAFTILTGARDRAIVSFKLKHIDPKDELVQQDARQVRTKRAKTFTTWFFPVGADIEKIVVEWVAFLRDEKDFGPEDPIFPKTRIAPGPDLKFAPVGLDRAHWANAHPVRAIFKAAFERVGLPYYNPHSLRDTLTHFAYELGLDAEKIKAWSQNIGHEDVLTTLINYGSVAPHRQGEIIRGLATQSGGEPGEITPEMLRQLAEQMERAKKAG